MPEEVKHSSQKRNTKIIKSVFEQDTVLFPYAKKGELTDIDGFYRIEERDHQEESLKPPIVPQQMKTKTDPNAPPGSLFNMNAK